jgi:hypothetical protein
MRRALRETLRAALKDRPFAVLVALFLLFSLSDLTLSLVGIRVHGFTGNPLFQLLAARSVVVGSLIWLGVTLVVSANMVIAYPAAPVWARREALLFCLLMALVLGSDGWTLVHLLAR